MFRFTIRDVLWLTALVAMAAGWWVDRYFLVEAYRGARTGYILESRYADRLYFTLDQMGRNPPKRWPWPAEEMKEATEQADREVPVHTRFIR